MVKHAQATKHSILDTIFRLAAPQVELCLAHVLSQVSIHDFNADFDDEEIGSEDGWDDDLEDSAEGVGDDASRANRRRGKGTGNPGKPGKKLRLADLQSQFGVGLKVRTCGNMHLCILFLHTRRAFSWGTQHAHFIGLFEVS